jgi:hypothetical protein
MSELAMSVLTARRTDFDADAFINEYYAAWGGTDKSDIWKNPAPRRIGARRDKVSEFTLIFPFAKGGADSTFETRTTTC